MTTKDQSAKHLKQLSNTLRDQPKEVAEQLLKVLQDRLGPPLPTAAQLTGLVLEVSGRGKVEIVETNSKKHVLSTGDSLSIVPLSLSEARNKRGEHPQDRPAAPAQPFPASVLFVTARGQRAASTLKLDAAALYRNWGQWGPMQLVLRRAGGRGGITLDVVATTTVELQIDQDETIEIIGVGYSPRIDPSAIFAGFAAAQTRTARGNR